MIPQMKKHLLQAFILAEGLAAISGIIIRLAGLPWRRILGDALFVEGAVLLVAGGLLDFGRSVTVTQIRRLNKSNFHTAPPPVKKPGPGYVLLFAGLLLSAQGVVLVFLFPAA